MSNNQCLRGMRDLGPDVTSKHRYAEQAFIESALKFGYQEVRFPTLENIQLFEKSIGIETDVIGQEMYQFSDKNDEHIALRPEGTAGCLRAAIANGLIQRQRQKFFYLGQMFRRERPQKGRYREFTHFGVETFGYPSGLIDVELITLSQKMWEKLEISDLALHINYLGSAETRARYHEALQKYWVNHEEALTEDEKKRGRNNPLRLLDSKNPAIQELINNAPKILSYLSDEETSQYQMIKQQLDALHIHYIESSSLVRGLDYYSDFIFEWISDKLGAQGTVCGGGRYDILTKNMGCETYATGFAIGIDRLALLLPEPPMPGTKVLISSEDGLLLQQHFSLVSQSQAQVSFPVNFDAQAKKVKNIHQAEKRGYTHTIILLEQTFKLANHQNQNVKKYPIQSFMEVLAQLENHNAK